MSETKDRLDNLLVSLGLVETRAKARALIMAGEVTVEGRQIIKPGTMVPVGSSISISQPPPYVSRGGLKLEYALDHFHLDVTNKIAADIGASTGGFTDCLLKRGAKKVYAIDVGTGQLDYRLRKDPRVVVMEGINARFPFSLPEKVDLITIDVSFISVEKIIPPVATLLGEKGYLVVLIKPQFEARKEEVGKRGVIRNPEIQARVLGRFIHWLTNNGFRLRGLVPSPVQGASGNQEFLLLLLRK